MLCKPSTYQPLTLRMAVNLAAPHTWPAAILPLLVAVVLAASQTAVSVTLVIDMLLIVVLMQSSVNTFNDYYDYLKGTDDPDAAVDESDAVLVYNNVNPRSALILAISFLVIAFLLGIYPIVVTGWIPLVIALVGALFVVLYSAGKTPISYLPLGELISGLVMGGLIPLAAYFVLTRTYVPMILIWSLPTIIGVGLIMLTNNTSDIERDKLADRHTLPVLLGRERSRALYHILVVIWICLIILFVVVLNTAGALLLLFMLLAVYPLVSALFANPLTQEMRLKSMPQILNLNIVLGAFYALALGVGTPLLLCI